jgi:hypothetical protein
MSELASQFQSLSAWRDSLATSIERLRRWLGSAKLLDPDTARRLDLARERISNDRLVLAFVAEFSRGKSELINAMFFADYGCRVLPAAAGRTTMCPTEILYDDTLPPSIRLLPIETRARLGNRIDFGRSAAEWQVHALDTGSVDGMLDAFRMVAQTVRVSADEARIYGLYDPGDPEHVNLIDAHGMMEISRWRHAIINFPHPLLRDGLVVIDTPGLNALGTEPELTLSLIPGAHAVLFMLSADAGVSRSDLASWQLITRDDPARSANHLAVLNKIDTLWDELRSADDIDADIDRQVGQVANTLHLDPGRVFPVSAQKGLVAKVHHDASLLQRSRLPALEDALSSMLVPAQREHLRRQALETVDRVLDEVRHGLGTRERILIEQLFELRALQGKNQGTLDRVARRAQTEQKEFEDAVRRLFAARAMLMRMSEQALQSISMDTLRLTVGNIRDQLRKVRLSPQFGRVTSDYFARLREQLRQCVDQLAEMERLVNGLQQHFGSQFGWSLPAPLHFTADPYLAQIDALENQHRQHFGTWDLLTRHQWSLIERFFQAVIDCSRQIFQSAQRDTEAWTRSLLPPLEIQAREHRNQLRKRADATKRIQTAQISLDERIAQLEESTKEVQLLQVELRHHAGRIHVPFADSPAAGAPGVRGFSNTPPLAAQSTSSH